jgi:hypothetical protein
MLIINSFVGLHPVYGTLVLWIGLRSNRRIEVSAELELGKLAPQMGP